MRLRVLIADPDKLLLAAYRAFLAAEGVQVVTVANGPDCLAALRQATPDVLILDPELPGEAGVGIMRRMREGDVPAVPVLVLTAHPEVISEGGAPSHDYALLLKPVRSATVIGVIRSLAESALHRTPERNADPTLGPSRTLAREGSPVSRGDSEGVYPLSNQGLEFASR
jgi:DNA-binding response OmpR family regulator